MGKLGLHLFLLFSLSYYMFAMAGSDSSPDSAAKNFIKSSCKTTTYTSLCVPSLSKFASKIQQNKKQLAQTALSVSLTETKSTAAFLSKMTKVSGIKPRESQAVKDCIENMGNTVDRLSNSIKELGKMGQAAGKDFTWDMSNVQTWVSAAQTDENTCVDGFSGPEMNGNVKDAITKRVNNVA